MRSLYYYIYVVLYYLPRRPSSEPDSRASAGQPSFAEDRGQWSSVFRGHQHRVTAVSRPRTMRRRQRRDRVLYALLAEETTATTTMAQTRRCGPPHLSRARAFVVPRNTSAPDGIINPGTVARSVREQWISYTRHPSHGISTIRTKYVRAALRRRNLQFWRSNDIRVFFFTNETSPRFEYLVQSRIKWGRGGGRERRLRGL